MSHDEVTLLSGAELLEAYRERRLSPVEVTQATLERIDRLNPALNAYLAVDHEGAQKAAKEAERLWGQPGDKPALCGVPVSIKDLINTSWLPTTYGSLVFCHRLSYAVVPAFVHRAWSVLRSLYSGESRLTRTPPPSNKPMKTGVE